MSAQAPLILHDYWRSSASYRVRIALNLKGLSYRQIGHDLREDAHSAADYVSLNPQGLVPTLETQTGTITQSGAIIEWIDERFPAPPLLPVDPDGRAIVRSMAMIIGCDIHPLNNLRVLKQLRGPLGQTEEATQQWAQRWISQGFTALEALVSRHGGTLAYGDKPTMADCYIVPQIYSARRFSVALDDFPRLTAIADRAAELDPFARAHPDRQSGSGA
jgi:maleylpyruvate isomerase